tara:strand:+ start:1621 stop:2574 length:954 start_codon:yes stop_codon:yes gene_type:complete
MKSKKIGLGTAAIGRPQYINVRNQKPESFDLEKFRQSGLQVLESAYQQGVRYFDTAPGYGMAEQLISDWLQSKNDPSIEVATKWGYEYVANFNPDAKVHEIKDHSIDQLIKQWEVSKELLPFLSTLQIHSATFETGVLDDDEVLAKLAEFKSNYGINIGLSTTGENQVDVLKKALDIQINGKQLFNVFQVTFNILDQSILEVLDILKQDNNRIVIKEALANGRLFPHYACVDFSDLYQLLESLALKYNTGIDAIALQFCHQALKPFMVLSGASHTSDLVENLKTNNLKLSSYEIESLKSHAIPTNHYWNQRKQMNWN